MEQTVQPSLRTARVIASALPSSVVLFWIVGWVVTGGGQAGIAPEVLAPEVALWIWAVAALAGFVGALAFRRKALREVDRMGGGSSGGTAPESMGEVQKHLLTAWAFLEGPALLSAVLFLCLAAEQILWNAVVVYLVGVVVTFPRAKWFRAEGGQALRT